MSPKVSIIVPVYNVENYIDECVYNLVNQTYKDIEILLIDDGSNDSSLERCKEWQKKDERIKLFENAHKGVSVARNTGIDYAVGEWLCFVDSDDYAEVDMLERLVYAAGASSMDFIFGGFNAISNNEIERCSFYNENIIFYGSSTTFCWERSNSNSDIVLKECTKDLNNWKTLVKDAIAGSSNKYTNIGVPWARLYKKAFINSNYIRFSEGLSRMQDTVFNVDVFMHFDRGLYINTPVYNYRIRDGSVTKDYNPNFHNTAYQVLELLSDRLQSLIDSKIISNPIPSEISEMESFVREVLFAKKYGLLIEIVRLELVKAPSGRRKSFKEAVDIIRRYEQRLFVEKDLRVKGKFLSKNQALTRKLLAHKREDLFYLLMLIKSHTCA